MNMRLALVALAGALFALPAFAQSFSPAVNAKKAPSDVQIRACAQEFKAKGIPDNGFQDFMKNCLKRKTHPAAP